MDVTCWVSALLCMLQRYLVNTWDAAGGFVSRWTGLMQACSLQAVHGLYQSLVLQTNVYRHEEQHVSSTFINLASWSHTHIIQPSANY